MDDREILFTVIVKPDPEDGGYVASTPTLKGVYGQGETEEEAVRDFQTALDFTLHDMVESGEELPESDESARSLPTVEDAGRAYRALAAI
ncbi:MAG: type II toxin-antitoxin system HicB family antitoxin [Actinomycetota bacterium]|nr:type II toxin-antitoxin system HicB family antitoxin [Actinomycetota bacterium]